MKVGYDSMSAICFWTTEKRNLPRLSYIFRTPEPLRTEFKTVTCSVTGEFIFVELQKGMEETKNIK